MSLLHFMADVTRLAHARPMAICDQARHDRLKADPETFSAHTTHLGFQGDEEIGVLRLANCNACGSTLSAPAASGYCPACGLRHERCLCGMGA